MTNMDAGDLHIQLCSCSPSIEIKHHPVYTSCVLSSIDVIMRTSFVFARRLPKNAIINHAHGVCSKHCALSRSLEDSVLAHASLSGSQVFAPISIVDIVPQEKIAIVKFRAGKMLLRFLHAARSSTRRGDALARTSRSVPLTHDFPSQSNSSTRCTTSATSICRISRIPNRELSRYWTPDRSTSTAITPSSAFDTVQLFQDRLVRRVQCTA